MPVSTLFEPWLPGAPVLRHMCSSVAPDFVPFSISSSPTRIFLDPYSALPACRNQISAHAKISAKSFIKSPEQNKVGGRLGPQEGPSRRPGDTESETGASPGAGTQGKKG